MESSAPPAAGGSRIAVFGLGYVGSVAAGCLAAAGHTVVGVDVNVRKVAQLDAGEAPVLEAGLPELAAEAAAAGRLRATDDAAAAVAASDLSLICVGTPSAIDGGLSTGALREVCTQIGSALRSSERRHTVVVRSTILPGTSDEVLIPALEKASGLSAGRDFGYCVNPEFLREGSGVEDFHNPAKTVIGELDAESGAALEAIYAGMPGEMFRVPVRVAELAKYVDNSFHALKVGYANEIGAISAGLGIDSHQVMEIFRSDTKLNISGAYLTPGFTFGGSCLPKDLRALMYHSDAAHLEVPIIAHVLTSNRVHFRRTLALATQGRPGPAAMLGLAFKAGTDELRESPYVELAESLIGKGFDLRIYDPSIDPDALTGTNLEFIDERVPHLRGLLVGSAAEALDGAETVVVNADTEEIRGALEHIDAATRVLDLVRVGNVETLREKVDYHGIAW